MLPESPILYEIILLVDYVRYCKHRTWTDFQIGPLISMVEYKL